MRPASAHAPVGPRPAQVVVDPHAVWHEPTRSAELLLRAAPAVTCAALAGVLEKRAPERDRSWLEAWRSADATVPAALADAPEPCEPRAYTAAAGALPEGAIVWVASSMPVRDVESFWPAGPERVRFLANRGANGIDGTIASAAGAARATGAPTLVLTGELALVHDLGGLLAARRARIDLTVLCVNNAGGGIFDFLPVAGSAQAAAYEDHVATPAGVDLRAVAALAGMEHRHAESAAQIRATIAKGPCLIEVSTGRAQNVRVHRQITDRAHAAMAALARLT